MQTFRLTVQGAPRQIHIASNPRVIQKFQATVQLIPKLLVVPVVVADPAQVVRISQRK